MTTPAVNTPFGSPLGIPTVPDLDLGDIPPVAQLAEGAPIQVMPDAEGWVRFEDSMGDDFTPAKAARMSTGGANKSKAEDLKLMRFLAEHGHTSPFHSVRLVAVARMPIVVLRELDRHRTLLVNENEVIEVSTHDNESRQYRSQNEMSGRYTEMPQAYYAPPAHRLARQSGFNKQASGEPFSIEVQQDFVGRIVKRQVEDRAEYEALLEEGLAREAARFVLPNTQYTTVRIDGDIFWWSAWLRLRLEASAQWEIRQYARAVEQLLRAFFPELYPVMREYFVASARLPESECRVLAVILENILETVGEAYAKTWQLPTLLKRVGGPVSARERAVIYERLGLGAKPTSANPWGIKLD